MIARRALLQLLGAGPGAALLAGLRVASAADVARLQFGELYGQVGPLGLRFSDKALGLRGQPVAMRGFLAPPLKPDARLFVLSARPVALCPFCQSDADWPHDIVVVYPRSPGEVRLTPSSEPLEITGVLELGSHTDDATGFVSQVRLVDARGRAV
jgi:hypothetical protein